MEAAKSTRRKSKSKEVIKRLNEENAMLKERVNTLEMQNKIYQDKIYYRLDEKEREKADSYMFALVADRRYN